MRGNTFVIERRPPAERVKWPPQISQASHSIGLTRVQEEAITHAVELSDLLAADIQCEILCDQQRAACENTVHSSIYCVQFLFLSLQPSG